MSLSNPWPMPDQVARRLATPDRPAVAWPPSWAWDFDRGDVATDGAGRVLVVTGEDAWRQWVRLTVMTQQAAYAAFGRAYGPDLSGLLGLDADADVGQVARRIFQPAVMADPRTASLGVVVLEQGDDLVRLRLDAKSRRGGTLALEVAL